jgi:thiol-disulfide isomerase/thioredoxin
MNKKFTFLQRGILVSVLMVCLTSLSAQNSYKITVRTNTFRDSACYLGYYYGKFQYVKDTANFDKKGIAVFEKKNTTLDRGVYFILFPNTRHIDFIINKEQIITFDVDTADMVKNTKITGSKENQLFYEYNREAALTGEQFESLRKLEEKYKETNNDSAAAVRDRMMALNKEMQLKKEQFMEKYPQSLVTKIFLLTRDPEIPDTPLKPDGTEDKEFQYYFYKSNYWNYMDFTEDALVRTPVLHPRLERFITQVIVQHPDSIIKEIDLLVARTENTPELFKYFVWFLTFHFESSQIMGHDAVFVHLIDTYYKTGRAFWASETVLQKTIERAEKLSPILIGKTAPNFSPIELSLTSYKPLWSINSRYIVLIFWDPDCGHCKKEIERLNSFYKEEGKKMGVSVFSVCTDTSMTRWNEKVEEKGIQDWINVNGTRSALGNYQQLYDVFSTPLIFLLDSEKKIIAKRLGADQVPAFLKQYEATRKEE